MDSVENIRKGYLKGLTWVKKNFYLSLLPDEQEMLDNNIEKFESMLSMKYGSDIPQHQDDEWEDSQRD